MTDGQPGGNHRWMVLGIIMLGTFMAILDSSIVNVALPHMMAAFGVTRDEIEWVATAFMLATAVAMPIVGWLVSRVGHKALYLTALALFTGGSALCAFSWSYNTLVGARVIQALGGGAMQPVGMAIVADLFEPQERGRALGVWGTGIMVGPALGPTLGGYLTDTFNWRVIFSVNLPIGVLTFLAGLAIMRAEGMEHRRRIPFDIWGFITLALALISGLVALANGAEKGWSSTYIVTCLILTVIGLVLFIAIEQEVDHPLLDFALFRYRNFTLSIVLAVFRSVGLFGGVFLLPIFLQTIVGYTTIQTGLWMMPGAVAVGITMPFAGRLADRYGPRWLVTVGVLATVTSLLLYGNLDPLSSATMIIGPQVLRGIGLALMMAPLLSAALNAVPRAQVATASSFLNVAQTVGGSFGIAVLNSYVTNSIQRHAVDEGGQFAVQSTNYARVAARLSGLVIHSPRQAELPSQLKGAVFSARTIMQRASVLGFDNGFVVAAIILSLGLPLALLLKPAEHHVGGGAPPPASDSGSTAAAETA